MVPSAPDPALLSIHNEVLCFVSNKFQTMPFEALVKCTVDFYSSEKIHMAKELLWESVITPSFPGRTDLRLIKRKNGANSKERADMEDVLKALQVCDKEGVSLPQFYALDLGNIPPISPEQLDINMLLGQFHAMKQELCQLKEAVQLLTVPPINPAPAQTWAEVASNGPTSLKDVVTAPSEASKMGVPKKSPAQSGVPKPLVTPVGPQQQQQQQRMQKVSSDGFIAAYKTNRNGRKRKEVKGTGQAGNLKGVAAPPRTAHLFVGRLDVDTTCEAVAAHTDAILGDTGKATVVEIPHCVAKYGYKGYKVQVPAEALSTVMQADKWPAHVSVKRYYQPKVAQPATAAAQGQRTRSRSVDL